MRFLLLALVLPLTVAAQELHVLSGGAAKSLVEPLAASLPLAVGQATAASGDDFAVSATPECPC